MPPTTIKLPAELKERIASLIQGTGMSMHAFLLEAIEQQAQLAERRQHFVADALAARAESLRTGTGYAAAQVHAYARARAGGGKATRPKARSWRR
jgi:predicted DNA-binding protein